MKKRTIGLIIAIGLEILDWLKIILMEKGKTHDSKANSTEK